MNDSVRLGRIAGVRVGLHWSLLLMVVVVAWGLAENRLPIEAPGHSTAAYAVTGCLTAVGLLIGVLLHELGHALVARWRRLSVDGITLSWMGGVTRIEGDTGTAGNELLVSFVGPAVSAAAGGLFALSRLLCVSLGASSLALSALGWLAWINLALAAFNLLPAAPLDGGRVLHGLVWLAGRDRWRATRVAAGAGVVLGLLFVLAGLLLTQRNPGDLFNGFLIGFIGWWMFASARAELGSGALHRALDGVTAAEVMRPVGDAPGWITIRAFVEQYAAAKPGWVWLLRDWSGNYTGVVVGDELTRVPFPQWDLVRPLDVATPLTAAAGAKPADSVMAVLSRTIGRQIVFVIGGDRTLGAIVPSDLEGMIRDAGRTVAGRRPAPRRAS